MLGLRAALDSTSTRTRSCRLRDAFAAFAFALTRPVLLVNDGHVYFEMARAMRHGTLEIPNGLDVADSPELWIENAVEPRAPPLREIPAVLPRPRGGAVRALRDRGLYL